MADHQRLDQAVNARRLDLGLSWIQLAERARISDVSLRNFRKGRGNPNDLSKRRLEDALNWAPGSIDSVLAGGDPAAVLRREESGTAAGMTAHELRQQIADLRDEIQHLAVRHERNRPLLVAHLERQIADLEKRLNQLPDGE